jgi:CDP-6-deoxy-D-xylo-4-hexulose-3-dehydrase
MRDDILNAVGNFYSAEGFRPLIPGQDYIPVSGKVIDAEDLKSVVDATLDICFTAGRFARMFEKSFARFMDQKFCLLVNSGSSANLVAFSALTSVALGNKRITPGSEVITVAAGFPTTVNPIFQNGCIPVFVDIEPETYQIDLVMMEKALSSKTRAVMLAHTLGNPFNSKAVKEFCKKHDLWLIEDCCDAVGSRFDGQQVGTFGDIATVSFYPAHHMTMGEGGAVLTSNPTLKKIAESFRDWGRDCWCPPGMDNTCQKRFDHNFEDMPTGYDHKYIYTHVGYNLKVTDMQAALGVSQLKKLPGFIEVRKRNFQILKSKLTHLENYLDLPRPTPGADVSWFGFPILVKKSCPKTRNEIIQHLENNKIGTRLLFAGNLVRQPLYKQEKYRVVESLEVSDKVMEQVFWLGLYPALDEKHFEYMADVLTHFLTGQS